MEETVALPDIFACFLFPFLLACTVEPGSDKQTDKKEGFRPRKRRLGPNIEGFVCVGCLLLRAYNKKKNSDGGSIAIHYLCKESTL